MKRHKCQLKQADLSCFEHSFLSQLLRYPKRQMLRRNKDPKYKTSKKRDNVMAIYNIEKRV